MGARPEGRRGWDKMARMRRALAWVFGGMAAVGCSRPATTKAPEVTAPAVRRPAAPDPELLAVADAVDPGPQAPLLSALPENLRGMLEASLGAAPDGTLATREIREALMNWDKLGGNFEQLPMRLLVLGRGLVLAERAVAAGNSDAELLLALTRAYALLDSPFFATQQGMFQQLMGVAAQMAQASGVKPGELDVAALVPVLKDMFARAAPLHRRTAAEFLRKHGAHPEAARVLGRLADDALRREDYGQALAWRKMALGRLGSKATASEQLELARTCYRGFDLACGDAALARGRAFAGDPKATAEHDKRVAWTVKTGEQAKRARALEGEAGLDAAIERGHLLIQLERSADALALFDRLRASHPQDARPYGGLAKLAVQRSGDFKGAAEQVELGKALANKDREYYEVALGTVGVNFLYEALPQIAGGNKSVDGLATRMLADLRSHAAGFRRFDAPRAAVVELIVEAVQAALPAMLKGETDAALQLLRTLPTRVEPLRTQYPDSPDVRRLVELAAHFQPDAERALAWMSAPLSPTLAKDPALQRSRVSGWLDVALTWERADQLPALAQAIEALEEVEGDHLRARLAAVMLTLKFNAQSDRAAGEQAAGLFAGLVGEGTAEQRGAAKNNLGVLRVALGDPQKGIELLSEAAGVEESAKPAILNLAAVVLTLEGAQRAELADGFAIVARDGKTAALRLQAAAWKHTQAERGMGDVEQTRAEFLAALASERKSEFRGTTPLGRWGVISSGSFQVSFFYSTTQGFQIRNEVGSTLWLVFPAPALEPLLAAKPAKVKSKAGAPRRAG